MVLSAGEKREAEQKNIPTLAIHLPYTIDMMKVCF